MHIASIYVVIGVAAVAYWFWYSYRLNPQSRFLQRAGTAIVGGIVSAVSLAIMIGAMYFARQKWNAISRNANQHWVCHLTDFSVVELAQSPDADWITDTHGNRYPSSRVDHCEKA
jgi:hypothetical protein